MANDSLKDVTRDAWVAVGAYPLGPITDRLRRKGYVDAERLELEFRRLAALWLLHPGQRMAPSKRVDRYWHEIILDTHRYRNFCQSLFGRFIEHIPDDTKSGMMKDYVETRDLYALHFGNPDPEYWEPTLGANSFSCGGGGD